MRIHFFQFRRRLHCRSFALLAGAILLCACETDHSSQSTSIDHSSTVRSNSMVRHARGFELIDQGDYEILNLFRHYNEKADTLSYLLSGKTAQIPQQYENIPILATPVSRIALLHSSYVSYFDFCQSKEHIKAISEAQYIFDEDIYRSVTEGSLEEVGYGEALDREQLLALDIDLVITVGWPNSPNKSQHSLEELGIPMLLFSEWQESTLLGRMEWVKVVAALTGKKELAYRGFDRVVSTYDSLKRITENAAIRPEVLCNLPYKGSWYVPGGNSYMSNLIADAGGNYLWSDNRDIGGLQLDFEMVFATGMEADFWINPGIAHSIREILEKDERLEEFKSLRNENIYNAINRIAHGQANDYWESGIVNPHLVLSDMIRILHPDKLPGHELVYFRKLQ